MNPCDGLPSAAHDIYLCVQRLYRPGKPFEVDLSALDVALDPVEIRDHLAGLLDVGILRSTDHGYVYDSKCGHFKADPVNSPLRKVPPSVRLAERFIDETTLLEPMSLGGNKMALAKNISSWLKSGFSEDVVVMLINEFMRDLRTYCPPGAPHWKAFVSNRQKLLVCIEKQWVDQHGWDSDFEQRYLQLFGRRIKWGDYSGSEFAKAAG